MQPPSLLAKLIAEFIGTMIIILFGAGVCAMTVLFATGVPGEIVKGGYTNITFGWGLGVTFGVWATARISGAHLNPAVTVALAVFRGFRWTHVLPFIAAQTAGAFAGAALVFTNYRAAFQQFDPMLEKTAGIFTTFPAFPAQPAAGFIDQVVGTALLLFLVLVVTDDRNEPGPSWFAPVAIGAIVVAIGISFGALHGYAINPARDLGPRLFTVLAGFRNNGLTDSTGVWWVPIVAPLLGGLLGAGIYDLGIRRFLPQR
ncbi:MAG: aquaporin family protein [Bryobacteraceae bacterium]|nr:aquaporin family protein [Bryobacteraceae bacterium]